MRSDIDNLSESGTRLDHIHFAVDAANVTQDMIGDLSHSVHAMATSAPCAHLFDRSYHPHASVTAVADPLKFHVRRRHGARLCALDNDASTTSRAESHGVAYVVVVCTTLARV